MIGALIHRNNPVYPYLIPLLVTAAALSLAVVGALLTGDEANSAGVNGLIEGLSGDSSSFLGGLGFLAPLGFAFAAGMVSTVNPCGFAMLPAYLGLYLGANPAEGAERPHVIKRTLRPLVVAGVVTSGFVLLFGVTGVLISAGAQQVVEIIPWVGLSIGVVLAIGGAWLMSGGKLYTSFAGRAASRLGNPGQVRMRGYFIFGVSYGTASLSSTLPIFLSVIATTLAVSGFLAATGQSIVYALGMGLVILALTVGMALFQGSMVGLLRKALRFIQPVSAVMMVLAGTYIVFYWLTIGGLW